MNLQQRLRSRREARNLRNAQVARALAISTAHVSDMETGKSKPSLELLARLAVLYETSTDYLLGLTDDPRPVAWAEAPPPYAEKAVALVRRLSAMNAERLLAIGETLHEHEAARNRLAREHGDTMRQIEARIGRQRAMQLDESVAAAVTSGNSAALLEILLGWGLLPDNDSEQQL